MDTLDNCPKGSTCIVKKLIGEDRSRLAELGLSPGTEIKIINPNEEMSCGCGESVNFNINP